MGMFEYENLDTGEIRCFPFNVAGRDAPSPPHQIKRPDGVWERRFSSPGIISGTKDNGVKPGMLRRYGDLPVSLTLPKDPRKGKLTNRGGHVVREHKDGTYSTEDGRPIVKTKRDTDFHGKRSGCVID